MREDREKIGTIAICGYFTPEKGVTFTEEEKAAIVKGCKRIYELPSEYGCFGVGKIPTEPFNERRLSECLMPPKS